MLRHGTTAAPTAAVAMQRAVVQLRAAGIEEPQLEAELLLRHVLGLDKTCFYLRLPEALSARQYERFLDLLGQRLKRRPLAYITGHREFYDLDLHVAPGVLIPRPETELLVEWALRLARTPERSGHALTFVDVGTGSGAIALAVAKHLPRVEVFATDRSPAALAVAGYNARRLRLAGRVRFLQGDLLEPVPGQVDLVAANLPYVPTAVWETLAPEVRDHEPRAALDGGRDGLEQIRRLIGQLRARLRRSGAAVLEIDPSQAAAVMELAAAVGCTAAVCPDLAGLDRAVVMEM
ncbi:MAG TPA: peptide chain release factor N(5)-glutamine methyltransferase [Dehalococcoidia bacterium]|nr:peptide chain release factor N(5)-glutamine methyltransferase [Dehalococcoidia bacterium]